MAIVAKHPKNSPIQDTKSIQDTFWNSPMEPMDFKLEETLCYDSCVHLNAVADTLKNNYHLLLAYYVTCIAPDSSKQKAADAYCRTCSAENRRIHLCLECAFFGCFDICEYAKENARNSHMKDHAIANGHYFAVHINHGCIFCFKCDDYVYNEVFEEIYNDYKTEAKRINGNHYYVAWRPGIKEIGILKDKIKKISDNSFIGLRGIVNIGSSCYINCLLQVLMHNPLLRDFFLSDKHKCFKEKSDSCVMCEMFLLFQEFYSGKTSSFDPSDFYNELRKCGIKKPGEQQADTFEFFQEFLVRLESSCQKTHEIDDCNCMIHQTFYGVNQLSRKCSHCEAASLLPLEHFVDIPLDLKGENDSLAEILKRKCLERELISDYTCLTCKENNTTYKYTAIKKLPAVICFRRNSYESEMNFKFEESIDMSEYLKLERDIEVSNRGHVYNSYGVVNRYYLFGVISHRVGTSGGHYVAIVKQRKNRWFECNDEKVIPTSFVDVVKCKPYLLFYYKQL